jgi:dipeptidase E
LLHTLRETGFAERLKEYINQKGVVYGGSAGAIIFGGNILTASHMDQNDTNLKTFEGFNYLDNYSVWCHYESSNDNLIREYVNMYGYSVIALTEETGIMLSDGKLKVLGMSPAYIFTKFNKYDVQPNEIIK